MSTGGGRAIARFRRTGRPSASILWYLGCQFKRRTTAEPALCERAGVKIAQLSSSPEKLSGPELEETRFSKHPNGVSFAPLFTR